VQDHRIVYDCIDPAAFAREVGNELFKRLLIRDVSAVSESRSSRVIDLCGYSEAAVVVDIGYTDCRTAARQMDCCMSAKTSTGSGNEDISVSEIVLHPAFSLDNR
jgi:hypothetical protein